MTRRSWWVPLTAVVVAGRGVVAQGPRPMTIHDLLIAVRVGDPQLSPDGGSVLFVRTTTAMPAGKRSSAIWRVASNGASPATPFITDAKGDNSPRYLADGRVVFISSRAGAPEVFVAGADGSNPRQITHLSGGVEAPIIVSHDGQRVAFVSDVYPSCSDDACNQRVRDSITNDPVQMRRLTRLPFRHWDEWWEAVRHHVFVADLATGDTRDVTPGNYDSPPHNYEDGAIAFSPDGRTVAFVSKRSLPDSEMENTNHEVWTAPADRVGPAVRVTRNPAADMEPVFTPDGKSMVVRAQRRAGFESDRWYLDVYDLASHARRTVFTAPDLSADDYRLSRDGTTIWFTAAHAGAEDLYSVPVAGGTPRLVAAGGTIGDMQPGAGFVVVSKSTLTAPAELFRVALNGTLEQLTHENDAWLAQVDMPRVSSEHVAGALATTEQYWLLTPPGYVASHKYPVVFMIHGGPQGDWGDGWSSRWNPALWASQGWIVVAPNPHGSTGFGQAYVDEISRDWCGAAMTDLTDVFNAVARMPSVDSTRMAIAGASYGGYAVDWLIGHTNRFKAAVTHDGVFNLESMSLETDELWFSDWEAGGPPWSAAARADYARCSPHLSANKLRTPTLVITNEQDFRVPLDQGLQLFTSLQRDHVPSEALVFANEGHWVLNPLDSQRWHEDVFDWLKRYLNQGGTN